MTFAKVLLDFRRVTGPFSVTLLKRLIWIRCAVNGVTSLSYKLHWGLCFQHIFDRLGTIKKY